MRKIPCEVYSRVVGYLRPVSNWLPAKQQEFKDRITYNVKGEAINDKEDSERDTFGAFGNPAGHAAVDGD